MHETAGDIATRLATRAPEWRAQMANVERQAVLEDLEFDLNYFFAGFIKKKISRHGFAVGIMVLVDEADHRLAKVTAQYA